jgi:hypothetical protein
MGIDKYARGERWEREKADEGKDDEPVIWEDRMEGQTPPSTFARLLMSRNQGQEWKVVSQWAAPIVEESCCVLQADGSRDSGARIRRGRGKNGQEKNGGDRRTKFGFLIDCVWASEFVWQSARNKHRKTQCAVSRVSTPRAALGATQAWRGAPSGRLRDL